MTIFFKFAVYTYKHIYTYIYIYVCVCVCVSVSVCVYVCVCICMFLLCVKKRKLHRQDEIAQKWKKKTVFEKMVFFFELFSNVKRFYMFIN